MKRGVASFNDMFRRRLVVVFTVFLVAVLGIESRFVYLQVLARATLVNMANQQLETDSIPIKAKRGMIQDSTGRVLAEDVATWSLGLYMKEVKDPHLTAASIAPVLSASVTQLEKQIRSASSSFIYLKKQVGVVEYDALSRLDVPGIVLDKGYRRVYPLGALVSSVVGITGSDNQGLSGIEFQYDKELGGTDGRHTYKVSGSNPGEPAVTEDVLEPIPGKNIVLTIDSNIQYFAQQALMDTLDTYDGKRATCTILDPKTDAVLAMVDVPGVDPEHWQDASMSSLAEKAISANYEPGSVFKAATSVAGLETGTITLQSTFYSGGSLKVFDTVVHDLYPYGTMNLYAMLQHSSNVAFCQLSMKIGATRFYDCLSRYGFGKPTGIDLPGEESWHPASAVSLVKNDAPYDGIWPGRGGDGNPDGELLCRDSQPRPHAATLRGRSHRRCLRSESADRHPWGRRSVIHAGDGQGCSRGPPRSCAEKCWRFQCVYSWL